MNEEFEIKEACTGKASDECHLLVDDGQLKKVSYVYNDAKEVELGEWMSKVIKAASGREEVRHLPCVVNVRDVKETARTQKEQRRLLVGYTRHDRKGHWVCDYEPEFSPAVAEAVKPPAGVVKEEERLVLPIARPEARLDLYVHPGGLIMLREFHEKPEPHWKLWPVGRVGKEKRMKDGKEVEVETVDQLCSGDYAARCELKYKEGRLEARGEDGKMAAIQLKRWRIEGKEEWLPWSDRE